MEKKDTTDKNEFCYATLITSNDFLPGLQVMLHSLIKTKTELRIIVLLTPEVTESSRDKLSSMKAMGSSGKLVEIIEVPAIPNPNAKVHVEGWINAGYTKLHIFNLTQFSKIVYIDADVLVLKNVDELFDRPGLSAAPDVFPPDKLNAGVMVVEPSASIFEEMMAQIETLTSHDGGDTGFLNSFFPDWFTWDSSHRLPFKYNAQRTMHWLTYKGNPGYWNIVRPISILHFSSNPKPWSPDGQKKKGDLEMIWWHYFLESQMGLGMNLPGCPFENEML
jgi:glycogenin glucosyltransferase